MSKVLAVIFLALILVSQLTHDSQAVAEQYALLVGVRQYPRTELTSLKYTENDVKKLSNVLTDHGYSEDNVVLMTQSAAVCDVNLLPTASNIRTQLKLLLAGLDHEDTVLVGFSGHGIQFKAEETSYFCPADVDLSDRNNLISLSKVYEQLEGCQAGGRLLIVDACRDNPQTQFSKSSNRIELEPITNRKPLPVEGGTYALFSCSSGQQSFEDGEIQHGVFFYHVITGLSGKADFLGGQGSSKDGKVSTDELVTFVKKRTKDYVRSKFNQLQIPVIKSTGGSGEMILVSEASKTSAWKFGPSEKQARLTEAAALLAEIEQDELALTDNDSILNVAIAHLMMSGPQDKYRAVKSKISNSESLRSLRTLERISKKGKLTINDERLARSCTGHDWTDDATWHHNPRLAEIKFEEEMIGTELYNAAFWLAANTEFFIHDYPESRLRDHLKSPVFKRDGAIGDDTSLVVAAFLDDRDLCQHILNELHKTRTPFYMMTHGNYWSIPFAARGDLNFVKEAAKESGRPLTRNEIFFAADMAIWLKSSSPTEVVELLKELQHVTPPDNQGVLVTIGAQPGKSAFGNPVSVFQLLGRLHAKKEYAKRLQSLLSAGPEAFVDSHIVESNDKDGFKKLVLKSKLAYVQGLVWDVNH